MSDKKEVSQKARDAAGTIMHKLATLELTQEEAISALMLGLVISSQGVGVDKNTIIDNLSENWDVLHNANRLRALKTDRPQAH
jgi:hypothetical protein